MQEKLDFREILDINVQTKSDFFFFFNLVVLDRVSHQKSHMNIYRIKDMLSIDFYLEGIIPKEIKMFSLVIYQPYFSVK